MGQMAQSGLFIQEHDNVLLIQLCQPDSVVSEDNFKLVNLNLM